MCQMNQSIGSRSYQSFLFCTLWVVLLFLYYERTQRYPLLVVTECQPLRQRGCQVSALVIFLLTIMKFDSCSTVTPKEIIQMQLQHSSTALTRNAINLSREREMVRSSTRKGNLYRRDFNCFISKDLTLLVARVNDIHYI